MLHWQWRLLNSHCAVCLNEPINWGKKMAQLWHRYHFNICIGHQNALPYHRQKKTPSNAFKSDSNLRWKVFQLDLYLYNIAFDQHIFMESNSTEYIWRKKVGCRVDPLCSCSSSSFPWWCGFLLLLLSFIHTHTVFFFRACQPHIIFYPLSNSTVVFVFVCMYGILLPTLYSMRRNLPFALSPDIK